MTSRLPIRSWYMLQSCIDSAREGRGNVHIPARKLPGGRNY